jgi:hemoglobin
MIFAIAGAIVGWVHVPFETYGRQLGIALESGGGFADGQGVLLLLVILGSVWWKINTLRDVEARPTQLARLNRNLTWTTFLFGFAMAGAVVAIIGLVLTYAGTGSERLIWDRYIATGGFWFAYLVMFGAGLQAALRLRGRLRLMGQPEGDGPPPGRGVQPEDRLVEGQPA